jgi:hypothetical protein
MLGTFHSKFMVVDRKIGIISSNNIQDNSNMEMVSPSTANARESYD